MRNTIKTIGGWIVERELGRGGMGTVFLCHSPVSEQVKAAVKRIPMGDAATARRFVQEAEALACLDHPNVVRVMDIGEDRDHHYLAMAFAEGESLKAVLERGPMAPERARRMLRDLAAGLSHAHERGIAHRDVKPENIIVRHDGQVVIVDFGIAVASGRTRLTSDGMIVGTPSYLPPELFKGVEPSPEQRDIYALGQVFYEMLIGEVAFPGRTSKVFAAKAGQKNLDPGAIGDARLRALIVSLTHTDPAKRPASMADLCARLDALDEAPAPRLRPRWRRQVLRGSIALALLSGVAFGGARWPVPAPTPSAVVFQKDRSAAAAKEAPVETVETVAAIETVAPQPAPRVAPVPQKERAPVAAPAPAPAPAPVVVVAVKDTPAPAPVVSVVEVAPPPQLKTDVVAVAAEAEEDDAQARRDARREARAERREARAEAWAEAPSSYSSSSCGSSYNY